MAEAGLCLQEEEMEVCHTGFYTEDFSTQEVPAGFDFASYGEFRFCWFLSDPKEEEEEEGSACLSEVFPLS